MMNIIPRKQTGFGRMPHSKKRRDGRCANCGGENDRETIYGKKPQVYCKACHASYMRANRAKYRDLDQESRRKQIARSYAGVYLSRGKISKSGCQSCGSENSEMHHADYSKPLSVTWLCRACHIAEHRNGV